MSIATVSRVLNNSRRVNPEIAESVRKAVAELNYFPQRIRRKPKVGAESEVQTGTIALISLGSENRGWFEMPVIAAAIAAISRAAEQQHLAPLVTEMPDPKVMNPILRRKEIVGALVMIPGSMDNRAAATLATELPTVRIMGGQFGPTAIDHVTTDNTAVGFEAMRHLAGVGCKKVAFVTSAPEWAFVRQRGLGFSVAAEEAGVTRLALAGKALAEQAEEIAKLRPDGIFVSRDEEAVEMYRLLADRGVRPGKDLRVISCDNEVVRLSTLHPRPASIELGLEALAQQAVRQLQWRIRNRTAKPVRVLVAPQVVVAETI